MYTEDMRKDPAYKAALEDAERVIDSLHVSLPVASRDPFTTQCDAVKAAKQEMRARIRGLSGSPYMGGE